MLVQVKEKQSLMDISVQGYGDILQVFTIINDNTDLFTLRDNGGSFLVNEIGAIDLGFPLGQEQQYMVKDGSQFQNQQVLNALPSEFLSTCISFYRSPDQSIGDFNNDFNNDYITTS